jgi:branched-chain amino acid transport system ATP-binding protein
MTQTILTISDLSAAYGRIEALKGISIDVQQGEIVTLIGANGAGKSTLLKTICGALPPKRGRIHFDGTEITRMPTRNIIERGIAIAPEGRRIFPRMTVMENLQLGGSSVEPALFNERVARMEDLFPILRERRYQRAGTMSGGEQQMLAIARALVAGPRLLLLDEPSLGLAPLIVRRIFEVIKMIRQEQGVTVLLVEQNAAQALKLADRAYVLSTGQITLSGTGAELLSRPEVREAYLEGGGHGGDAAVAASH